MHISWIEINLIKRNLTQTQHSTVTPYRCLVAILPSLAVYYIMFVERVIAAPKIQFSYLHENALVQEQEVVTISLFPTIRNEKWNSKVNAPYRILTFFSLFADSASVVVHVVSGERPAAMQSIAVKTAPLPSFLLMAALTVDQSRATFVAVQNILTGLFMSFKLKLKFNILRFITRWPPFTVENKIQA